MKPELGPVQAPRSRRLTQLCRIVAAGVVIAAFVHNTASTWDRWGDLIVDCGRELDTPRQLVDGKTLYEDVRYWYGPLAPYKNALLYRLFGVHVRVLTLAGLTTAGLMSWLAYRLVRLFSGRWAAAAAAVSVLYVNAFAQLYPYNIFNFILPYAYAATYGMLAALASIYFLLRHVRNNRMSDFLISAALLSLTAISKLEVLTVAAAVHVAFAIMGIVNHRLSVRHLLFGYLPALVFPVVIFGYFYARTGAALWSENLFLRGNLGANPFTLQHSGLTDVGESLRQAALSGVGLLGCLSFVCIVSALERRVRRARQNPAWTIVLKVISLCLLSGLACGTICIWLGPFRLFRALPFLLGILLVVHVFNALTRREGPWPQLGLVLLYVGGLAGLSRVVLRSGAEHYGFYLLVPALIGFTVFWCRTLPSASRTGMVSHSAYFTAVAMLAGAAWTHHRTTRDQALAWYGPEVLRIRTERGTMPCPRVYTGAVDEVVRFLAAQRPGAKVVVMPEGAAIGFLAGCVNPLGVHTFLPIDLAGAYDDDAIVARLEAASPDYIVLTSRNVAEYGKQGFGIDYAEHIVDWLTSHYTVAKRFGSPNYVTVVFAPNASQ